MDPRCSAKDCREPAAFSLAWNNPRLHSPERRKTWLACADHRDRLAAFLGARGFLREISAFDPRRRRTDPDTAAAEPPRAAVAAEWP